MAKDDGVLYERDKDTSIFLEDDVDTLADKYLLFHLADELYGIEIAHVVGIEEMRKITDVPDMPPYIKGVINLRGQVIPIMDLRVRFGLDERPYDDRTCIVIVKIQDMAVGLVVDTVAEVLEIPPQNIVPPPVFKNESERDLYIKGLGKVGNEVKILLDVSKILYREELEKIGSNII